MTRIRTAWVLVDYDIFMVAAKQAHRWDPAFDDAVERARLAYGMTPRVLDLDVDDERLCDLFDDFSDPPGQHP